MIINDKYRFVFVHVPKTAGKSIQAALSEIEGSIRGPINGSGTRHETRSELFERLKLTPSSPMPFSNSDVPVSDYLFFGFVRNPWSRFCSMHKYVRAKKWGDRIPADVNDFARMLGDLDPWILKLASARPQSDFISAEVGFVGRYENLAHDFAEVMQRFGLTSALPHINSSGSYQDDYRSKLMPASAEIIAKHYESDIREFGYSF
jgi:hypothetical protein